MHIRRVLLGAVIALGFSVSAANATTIRFEDTYVPNPIPTLTDTNQVFSYNHDLTLAVPATNTLKGWLDGTLTAGADYDSATDTLTSGKLTLSFGDTLGEPNSNGTFALTLGPDTFASQLFFATIIVQGASFDVGWISTDGILNVSIKRTNAAGSVTFLSSVLDVNGCRTGGEECVEVNPLNGDSVPEPSSVILLGTGLAGLVAYSRRRARRS